jgi:hypothetical protein
LNYIADNPNEFKELDMILKSNGYDKVGVKVSSIFLLYFIDNFNREAKSMRVFIGTTYIGDISSMMGTYDWTSM